MQTIHYSMLSLAVLLLLSAGFYLSPAIKNDEVTGTYEGIVMYSFEQSDFLLCDKKEVWRIAGKEAAIMARYEVGTDNPGDPMFIRVEGTVETISEDITWGKEITVNKIITAEKYEKNRCVW